MVSRLRPRGRRWGPVRALLWEQWRTTGAFIIGLNGGVMIVVLWYAFVSSSSPYIERVVVADWAFMIGMGATSMILLPQFRRSSNPRLHSTRFRVLPVPQWKVALVQNAYRAVALLTVASMICLFLHFLWGVPPSSRTMQDIGLCCAYLLLSASLIALPEYTFGFLTRAVAIILLSIGLHFMLTDLDGPAWMFYFWTISLVLTSAQSEFRPGRLEFTFLKPIFIRKRAKKHSARWSAQLWYEWRRWGWMLPALMWTVTLVYGIWALSTISLTAREDEPAPYAKIFTDVLRVADLAFFAGILLVGNIRQMIGKTGNRYGLLLPQPRLNSVLASGGISVMSVVLAIVPWLFLTVALELATTQDFLLIVIFMVARVAIAGAFLLNFFGAASVGVVLVFFLAMLNADKLDFQVPFAFLMAGFVFPPLFALLFEIGRVRRLRGR